MLPKSKLQGAAFGFGVEEGRPGAAECGLKSDQRENQDGDVARLNLLNGPRIQRAFFCELLLREFAGDPFTANIAAEFFQFAFLSLRLWHALLRREADLGEHAPLGRILASVWLQ